MRMKTLGRILANLDPRKLFCGLAVCLFAAPLLGQPIVAAASPENGSAATGIRAIVVLDGQWRFHTGDDLRWADPAFNDSDWPIVNLSTPLVEQGIDSYSGWAWYRLKIQPQQLAQIGNPASGQQLSLLVSGNSVGQLDVFVNGIEAGHTKGMTESPSEYQSPPFVVQFNPASVRADSDRDSNLGRARHDHQSRTSGQSADLARRAMWPHCTRWRSGTSGTNMSSPTWWLHSCLSALRSWVDFYTWRSEIIIEYLWLGLLCLSVAAGGRGGFGFWAGDHAARRFTTSSRCSPAASSWPLRWSLFSTSQATKSRRFVRGVQIGVLLVPFVYFIRLDTRLSNPVSCL